MRAREAFYAVVSRAIADLEEHGFDSQERVNAWMQRIEAAAREALVPAALLQRSLRDYLERAYGRALSLRQIASVHPGVGQFTVERLKPALRRELDRRILASASLIKLNREASVQRTLQRFSGWATSIPIGGSEVAQRAKASKSVRRAIAGLPFEERRVIIDQGHKLVASVNDLIATDGGAIAGIWRHVREGGGYQARPAHLARDKKLFVIRDNWALKRGLMKRAGRPYTDEVTAPAEEPFCRCSYEYVYSLRDLPQAMLTAKGKQALRDARARIGEIDHAEIHAG